MRLITSIGSFLALVAAVYFLWQCRFERAEGISKVDLEDLQNISKPVPRVAWRASESGPLIQLKVVQGDPPPIARFQLPGIPAVDFLHLKFRVRANKLGPGRENWEDGRCIIEWHAPTGGSKWENDLFCSVRHDQEVISAELVVRPDQPPSIPVFRLENLGHTGDLDVSLFEATVVQERWLWKIGKWVLIGGWIAWALIWIRSRSQTGVARALVAAGIWVGFGIYFVIPGPWASYRSFGPTFELVGESRENKKTELTPSASGGPVDAVRNDEFLPTPTVGKIPERGSFALKIKIYAQKARPFLHVALLFGPAFMIACLVGRRSALTLSIIVAIAIEVAQFSFGFGFDRLDVFDLVCDSAGIALALVLHRYFHRHRPGLIAC
jgi:hypothetical protein